MAKGKYKGRKGTRIQGVAKVGDQLFVISGKKWSTRVEMAVKVA